MHDLEKERKLYLAGIQKTRKQIKSRQDHISALKTMYVGYFCPFKKGDKIKVTNGEFEEVGFVNGIMVDESSGEFIYNLKKVLKDGTQSQKELWHPMIGNTYEKVEGTVDV